VVTCGANREVCIYSGIIDEDPSSYFIYHKALAIACAGDKFFVPGPADTITVTAYDLAAVKVFCRELIDMLMVERGTNCLWKVLADP
jgi:hypothetical protein